MTTVEKVTKLQAIVHKDLGNRGIGHFDDIDSLISSANFVSDNATSIAIISGFCVPTGNFKPETDGPLGVYAMIKAFLFLGKKVTYVTDDRCKPFFQRIFKSFGILDKISFASIPVPTEQEMKECDEKNDFSFPVIAKMSEKILSDNKIDCVISIERVGSTYNGHCYSMGGIDISTYTGRTEILFNLARSKGIKTIGVGDGGNELGMGKMAEFVKQFVKRGDKIVCQHPADHVIVCGVSNWGGWALACAVYLVAIEKNAALKKQNAYKEMFPHYEEQKALLAECILNDECVDGMTGKSAMCVDGMSFEIEHKMIIDELNDVVSK